MSKTGTITTYRIGVDVVFEWQIENFFNLPETDSAWNFSPDFSFGDKRWYLRIFPNGSSEIHSSGHVDLRLYKYPSNRSIKQSFSLSLKTVTGEKYNEQNVTKDFKEGWDCHSFNRFKPRLELDRRRSKLAPEGVLTVVCTMRSSTSVGSASNTASASAAFRHCKGTFNVVRLSSHQKKCMNQPVKCQDCLEVVGLMKCLYKHECKQERPEAEKEHKENSENTCVDASTQTEEKDTCVEACTQTVEERLGYEPERAYVEACTQTLGEEFSFNNPSEDCGFLTDINHLLKENRGVDVTFELETANGKTKLLAHKLILAVMSSYFADEFYDKGRNEGHQVIPLKGVDPKAFKQMIRYCYGEKLSLRTIEDACALFKIASEFKVISLQNLCHTFFRRTKIEPRNVFSILKISVEIEDQSLQDMCYKILQEKTREVMSAYELCDITPAMVYTFLNLPKLSLNSEYELINWIFDWAKVKSEDKNSSCRSTRDYLAKLLRNMNFLALTVKDFVMLTRDNPKFFNSDEIASVSMNIVIPGTREMPVWHNKDLKGRVYTGSNE